jgi:hypothetical protein
MENYHSIVEAILELKRSPKTPRKFETEKNEYHNLRIQSTDIDIIVSVIEKLNINNFDFAAELYCRTLLAQIANFKYTEYFNYDYNIRTSLLLPHSSYLRSSMMASSILRSCAYKASQTQLL